MAQSQWLNDESELLEMVCGELDKHARDLFVRVRQVEGGFRLLRFLKSQVNTLRTIDDLAYHLRQPAPAIDRCLHSMIGLGLIRRMDACGVTWFGITQDQRQRRLVRDLCAWQDRWQAREEQIEQVIGGKPPMPRLAPAKSLSMDSDQS